ncbi:kinesin-like protein KIF15 isoform X2 [Rana temporaria]|uniref:kinesin-like protein KIF15 isoform X2 n=1 Tax=Rana temporaria TaxID=8407 RepID=UPI001AACEF13|nr:kinesin-like protein KIF15 isoform X2 [Rana temporaria]
MAPGTKSDLVDIPTSITSPDGDAIKVFVRIRPPVEGNAGSDGDQGQCLSVLSPKVICLHSKPEPKVFTFDYVANTEATQESVFSCVAKNIIESCLSGYNGTIFAYGQTGSGKTFTMLGPSDSDNFTHNLRGVIPRSFEYLFSLINREKEKAGDGKSFLCKCSFIEIYNEQIFDLLDSAPTGLVLREHIKKGVFIVGAVEQAVASAAEAYQVLSTGWRNRRVASTSMNRESSRSHAVFTVAIESMEKINEIVNIRSSQLNLVDLAGSERQKDAHTEGVRLKEAGSINRSLSCLGQVITALVDVANGKQRHICYRDSRLTFLLRDSLGGNAKTFIIANVHPGSRSFGETLSTLHFAQRAKLIKNKAVVNEDTQGNVSQLQAEVKKLKEQLSQLLSGQMPQDISIARAPSIDETDYMNNFLEAMMLLEKSENEKKASLQKVAQLEDLCSKKEKFIQSNKMIVKFREDHIARLEKAHRDGQATLSNNEQDNLLAEMKQELKVLKGQIEHHPRVAKYALENHSLREENKNLRSLQSVKRAQEIDNQKIADLERAFLEASLRAKKNALPMHSTPIPSENSMVSTERQKEKLLQLQSELATAKQEYEEFKELTKKKQVEQESELQSLLKSNKHLEDIFEAIKAHKRNEVSQLNKMHAETIKILTTPTKAYHLRSRLVPRLSPEGIEGALLDTPKSRDHHDNIINEPIPPEMSEQAYEAIAEELRMMQEQVTALQAKNDEEESKNMKLQQQVDKMVHHSTQMEELFSSERASWNSRHQELLAQINVFEKRQQDFKGGEDVLKSEVHDLRVVLQSADRELRAVKIEYSLYKGKQEKEMSDLSDRHINVQLQLDNVRLEHESLLEEKRSLQDAYDNLEEVMKFESDQLKQELSDSKRENKTVKAELGNLLELLETEKEHRQNLKSQLEEDKENKSRELLNVLEESMILKKQCSELTTKCELQITQLQTCELQLTASKEIINDLEKNCSSDKEIMTDLMNQIQSLRTTLLHKTESIDVFTQELEDLNSKYSSVLSAKEESKTLLEMQEKLIEELREGLERKQSADSIERELLCEDLTHATEQLGKLTEAFNNQEALLVEQKEELLKKEQLITELTNQIQMLEMPDTDDEGIKPPISNKGSPAMLLQTPKTPIGNPFDCEMTRLNNKNSQLEQLISALNEERMSKNEEIIRLKTQLCETENLRLEIQNLHGQCEELQIQLKNCTKGENACNEQSKSDMLDLKKEIEKEVSERLEKGRTSEQLLKMQAELEEARDMLRNKENSLSELHKELDRTRALELKEFQEKEEIRSLMEARNEETEKKLQESELLRRQIAFLVEENGKLLGHQNPQQKIQYLVKLKKDNNKLIEELNRLRTENLLFREGKQPEQIPEVNYVCADV